MYAVDIRFVLAPDTDWDALRKVIQERANFYTDVPGLHAKAFVLNPDTHEYGGNYIWETAGDAETFLQSELYQGVVAKFGQPADVKRYEIPAYVENGRIIS